MGSGIEGADGGLELVGLRVGVVGASGAVGQTLLRILEERRFPLDTLRLLATERSRGRIIRVGEREVEIEVVRSGCFRNLDLCFLAVPGSRVSRELAPQAVAEGSVVIDKGSAFRMDPDVPLVVPEVNPDAALGHHGIIASPNCTTTPLVMVLQPLRQSAGLRRVIVSTYQSASGAGQKGSDELRQGSIQALHGHEVPHAVFGTPLAFNAVPQCDQFAEDGYTLEEWKLVRESRKILGAPELRLVATAVRVPVFVAHSESVYVETDRPLSVDEVRSILSVAPGVLVEDDPARAVFPTALRAQGTDEAHVGRIRRDLDEPTGLHLWVVADNLRKGAATNAVQIAELLTRGGL